MTEEIKVPTEEKTPEQLKTERDKRYYENPDSFVELSELVCAVIKDKRSNIGIGVMVNNECSRSTIGIAEVELVHTIHKMRLQLDMTMAAANMPKIHKPGAMHNFMRGRKK